ncbi:hypothetical protein RclHR1_02440010 [Rhizophagus clarus]|uniref:Protein kinase domain-containing protein n=1 Tax=Rhizophagus clarus TaxID=94130 RepID=A0A2Z6RRZ5_9GLOM|nr:hypothetical protein RclHR1_02440010 [Rhizophagus clarus]
MDNESDSAICKQCFYVCDAKRFQQNFDNWTSGNDVIDKFIQDTQLSAHCDSSKVLEWIPYDKFSDCNYSAEKNVIKANWYGKNWKIEDKNHNVSVILKSLNNLKNIATEFFNEINVAFGITQDPKTKNYMMVLGDECKECNKICNAMHFQQNFGNWTSGNDDIDKLIQAIQLSTHDDLSKALEWIPYDKIINAKYITESEFGKEYSANWIDGKLKYWSNYSQNWERVGQKIFVNLKSLNNLKNLTLKFVNEIKIDYEFYGITQDPKTKNYIMVLNNNKCKECNKICNAMHFQQNFGNWTSGSDDIDKLIQVIQLSTHDDTSKALEWLPYDKFINIKYIAESEFGKEYSANWIDGKLEFWNNYSYDWKRTGQKMFVNLRNLNNSKNLTLKFINEIKEDYELYGITQNLETKTYMIALNSKCKECNSICNAMRFQQNFNNWTSGNDVIDKFIQDTQLSAHNDLSKVLEWMSYDKFSNCKYITENKVIKASWSDWSRNIYNKFVILKSINNLNNIAMEFFNEIDRAIGITQSSETKNYMMILSDVCEKCNYACNAICFQRNFDSWTSGNDDIDELIQNAQLLAHDDASEALEWIPYDKFINIKYITENEFGKEYSANWIDGKFKSWNNYNQDWRRIGQKMFVNLKSLNNSNNLTLKFVNEIKIDSEFYGITQDPKTKNYIMVLNKNKCKECNKICNAMHFQQNFGNWTSGSDDIDELIQAIQLSTHDDPSKAFEWIPYDKIINAKYITESEFGKEYSANWIDGKLESWNNYNQGWRRIGQKMFVNLKSLNNSKNLTLKFVNEIKINYEFYGITQDPKTKNYIMVLNKNKCKECNKICNAMHFQQNFGNWTSDNDDIDELIQAIQLSTHDDPKSEFGKEYSANWIDGKLESWNNYNQGWGRIGQKMFVNLKSLNNSKNLTLKFVNEIKEDYELYGITQNLETKTYMIVLNNKCKECNKICNAMIFQQNFGKWTSDNNDIDELIQATQLLTHNDPSKALEWIPYDKLINIKYIAESEFEKEYSANWIDGKLKFWSNYCQNWERGQKIFVKLKSLNNSKNLTLKFIKEIKIDYEFYGITQDPKTNNYIMVLNNNKCKECSKICNAMYFQQNFGNWTSCNDDIDELIQAIQLSTHEYASKALEWIPYDKFINIKYIAESEFGKEYSANWIEGKLESWNNYSEDWRRIGQKMFVNLKGLNNSKNLTLKFINEIKEDYEVYGITQNSETKTYMIVLSNKCKECKNICNVMCFRQNFGNWTSGNNDIDKLIQVIQLSTHDYASKALEWIPYDKFINIKYIAESEFGKEYNANWIDGMLDFWDNYSQNWIRTGQKMFVNLKSLNNSENLTLKFVNEIKEDYELYGVTQNPETKTYMIVLNNKCKKCNNICNAMRFQQNFNNWTSGNDAIDKFIQDTQLLAHYDSSKVLEWIPYNRFDDYKHVTENKVIKTIWYGKDKHMKLNVPVFLKSINNLNNIATELFKINNKAFGITQNPKTKNYMMVLSNICEKCNCTCNAILFQMNFCNWASGNDDIDKLIQTIQLSTHEYASKALEWIPYDKFINIKYIAESEFGKEYSANWIDGRLKYWNIVSQNWERIGQKMLVNLKSLNNSKNLTLKFINKIKIDYEFYGITQDPVTKNYIMVLNNNKCKECNKICSSRHFQQNFGNWTSDNDDIDELIQVIQLSTHDNPSKALEWIPYNKLINIKYIAESKFGKDYSANWIDGKLKLWNNSSQNWIRTDQKMFVNLKSLNNSKNLTLKFINEIKEDYELYGITQNLETKTYMIVLNNKCKECNNTMCNAMHFQQNFCNWTSGNDDIDKFIQDTQLSVHNDELSYILEWISYDRFYNIKYIIKSGMYKANWIDGCIKKWDNINQNWKREDKNMLVNLKSLDNLSNISLNFITEIKMDYEFYGITQDPETRNYMMVLNNKCKKCDNICDIMHFQQNFDNWTSGDDDIDKFIQKTQLSSHLIYNRSKILEWIPYNRFYGIKYITNAGIYKANWIDGYINFWIHSSQNWNRTGDMVVILKSFNNSKDILLKFMNEINKPCGITQNPETKNYMMVLKYECEKCDKICDVIHFQQNFENWTSGNGDIDKYIQDTQLSVHKFNKISHALEWIPYNRFYNIRYIIKDKICRANWIDGCIDNWNNISQNWKRHYQNMAVILKSLNNSKNISSEFKNEINKPCGITQDPKTKCYMMVLKYECKNCNDMLCNAINFQQNFGSWTSGNDDIDGFIQDTQLLAHKPNEISYALEWIPYDRFYNIKCITKGEIYKANWIDGSISNWDKYNKNWKRKNHNTPLILKSLNDLKNISLKFIDEIKINQEFYGITQDPETKLYMMVLNNKCNKCKRICNTMHFQQNFGNWTSGNDDIDKYIQYTQLLTHDDASKALEWIPYDRFYDVKYIEENKFGKIYKANWTDGCIDKWDNKIQNWKRYKQNMLVNLKSMNNSLELMTEIDKPYGITQDPETKIYIIVLTNTNSNTNICKKCNYICNAVYFRKNFDNWTSGNNIIDKFIQNTQLSAHNTIHKALEWISYNRFHNIKYIAKGGFGEVYKANWIDGRIDEWDDENKIWRRYDKDIVVALKSLNNSKNITLEFMNEMILHHKVDLDYRIIKLYGITQDPKTENYIMVMEFADGGSLRKYLTTNYNKLNWNNKISCLDDVISGLKNIHEKELIHRDLHIGNILKLKNNAAITDMGLCKPVNHDAQKNTVYGILPYIAPEILQGRSYTKDADIYSFGIIMYEVISGLPPYYDVIHDENLAIKICQGLRPRFKIKVPQLIIQLIKRCLDADQQNRPSAEEIINILFDWQYNSKIFQVQIEEADEINKRSLKGRIPSTNLGLSYKTHSEAIYKSRSLNFNSLPEPKNSDDYYRHNDNIISIESSVSLSLQINVPQLSTELKNDNVISVESSASSSISQLNVNDNNLPEPKSSNDYYKQSDNMISDESSALLSISQLNINDNNLSEPKISNDYYKQSDNMISVESSDINDNNLPKQKSSDDYYEDDISVKSSASLTICQLDINNNNLPESKDSDDYNKQDDNMINVESSEPLSLQICISQLNINDPEPKNSDDYY